MVQKHRPAGRPGLREHPEVRQHDAASIPIALHEELCEGRLSAATSDHDRLARGSPARGDPVVIT